MAISKAGSMKGWNFIEWLKKNKSSLKMIVEAASGIATAFVANLPPVWKIAAGTLVVAVVKIALDTLDFYTSDVKL